MKLILSGGGSGKQVEESYKLFCSVVGEGKVLYIPLAWNHGDYDGCKAWFADEMKPFGVTNFEMVTDAKKITKAKLENVVGIFIGGGNTYKLLKMLKDTQAFGAIQEFLKREDGVIMGGSAGALIFGKSIDTCLDDGLILKSCVDHNEVGLKDSTGFDCLGGFSILPHYKKLPEQYDTFKLRISRLLKDGFKLVCIPEESSVLIENGKCSAIGKRPVEVFENNKQFQSYQCREQLKIK